MKIAKLILLSSYVVLFYNASIAQIVFERGYPFIASNSNKGVAFDSLGNIYSVGNFTGTIDVDLSSNVYNLTSFTSWSSDFFIKKEDALGNLVWAKSIGGTGQETAWLTSIDPFGNVLTVGSFNSTTDFDPGSDTFSVIAVNNTLYVHKMTTNGTFEWVKKLPVFSSTLGDLSCDLTTDNLGNIYITGGFIGTKDFDLGTSIHNLTSAGDKDAFVLKLDPNGDFVWAKSSGGSGEDKGRAIAVDNLGNVYITGQFKGTVDFDPGGGTSYLTSTGVGYSDIYIQKLDINGNFVWAKSMGGNLTDAPISIATDLNGNVISYGYFKDTVDFDPGINTVLKSSNPLGAANDDGIYIQKLDANGNFIWVKTINAIISGVIDGMTIDQYGNIYAIGAFEDTVDIDPGVGVYNIISQGNTDSYIQKLAPNGDFIWAKTNTSLGACFANAIALDYNQNIYKIGICAGGSNDSIDVDPNEGEYHLKLSKPYVQKLRQKGVSGRVYQDLITNCMQDNVEMGLAGRRLIINPGNLSVTTNEAGVWSLDFLPAGAYVVTVDTTGNWTSLCSFSQLFTVVHQDSLTIVPSIGLYSTAPCASPSVSIHAPFLRPGFSNQKIYVRVCNENNATEVLSSGTYVNIELDPLLTIQSASLPFTNIGNDIYKVNTGLLYPGMCSEFWLNCTLDTSAILGTTLCMEAKLMPIDSCILDTIPNLFPSSFTPCNMGYDQSHLEIKSVCINDTIQFKITNTGIGDMVCYSPIQLYIDGQLISLDSIQLLSGDSTILKFSGDGRTWRLEVFQHPLHPGNSQPSNTIERCGSSRNWTPNLVNLLPQNDADPNVDIYCGIVTGSFDPNIKVGFPLGLHSTHDISANQDLEYTIQFQNTGTDTAFTVIIRDTLSMDLDLLSVISGVASHQYSFRIYGPRVLEWSFYDIKLPDSSANEAASHGFIKYRVKQEKDLPIGKVIENSAAIYFDFNAPIITNSTNHRIIAHQELNWVGQDTINQFICDSVNINGISYNMPGRYWQTVPTATQDSLYLVNLTSASTYSYITTASCDSFIAPDGQLYTISGQYTAVIPNNLGCDSSIIVDLTINEYTTDTITETSCDNYQAPNGQVYTSSGEYNITIPNTIGCDSIITIDLTILGNTINTSVSQFGTTLSAIAINANFQWLNCDSSYIPIVGETGITFTPIYNGNYAVAVTQNGCTDTSTCYNVVISNTTKVQEKNNWLAYPNPTKSKIYIDKGKSETITINLIDKLGRILICKKTKEQISMIDLSTFPTGLYTLKLIGKNNSLNTIIVKG